MLPPASAKLPTLASRSMTKAVSPLPLAPEETSEVAPVGGGVKVGGVGSVDAVGPRTRQRHKVDGSRQGRPHVQTVFPRTSPTRESDTWRTTWSRPSRS